MPQAPLATCDLSAVRGRADCSETCRCSTRAASRRRIRLRRAGHDRVGLDIFGGAFAMLTLLSKRSCRTSETLTAGAGVGDARRAGGFAQRPLVDEYAEVLWWAISRLWPESRAEPRARSRSIRRTMSTGRSIRAAEAVRDAARRRVIRQRPVARRERLRALVAIKRAPVARPTRATRSTFLMRDERGSRTDAARSTSWAAGRNRDTIRAIRSTTRGSSTCSGRSTDRGHELGVHPSYDTYRDAEALRRELATVAVGARARGHRAAGSRRPPALSPLRAPDDLAELGRAPGSPTTRRSGTRSWRASAAGPPGRSASSISSSGGRSSCVERPLIAMEAALLSYQAQSTRGGRRRVARLQGDASVRGRVHVPLAQQPADHAGGA